MSQHVTARLLRHSKPIGAARKDVKKTQNALGEIQHVLGGIRGCQRGLLHFVDICRAHAVKPNVKLVSFRLAVANFDYCYLHMRITGRQFGHSGKARGPEPAFLCVDPLGMEIPKVNQEGAAQCPKINHKGEQRSKLAGASYIRHRVPQILPHLIVLHFASELHLRLAKACQPQNSLHLMLLHLQAALDVASCLDNADCFGFLLDHSPTQHLPAKALPKRGNH